MLKLKKLLWLLPLFATLAQAYTRVIEEISAKGTRLRVEVNQKLKDALCELKYIKENVGIADELIPVTHVKPIQQIILGYLCNFFDNDAIQNITDLNQSLSTIEIEAPLQEAVAVATHIKPIQQIILGYIGGTTLVDTKSSERIIDFWHVLPRAIDRDLVDRMSAFMKQAETVVNLMITKNPQKYNAFRELQRKGVQWTHSPQFRSTCERAGFAYNPMMVKRDRMVCVPISDCEKQVIDNIEQYVTVHRAGCGQEISGMLETDLPEYFHYGSCDKKLAITQQYRSIFLHPDATIDQMMRCAVLQDLFMRAQRTMLKKILDPYVQISSSLVADYVGNDDTIDISRHIANLYTCVSNLCGWQHVSRYIDNPQLYFHMYRTSQTMR